MLAWPAVFPVLAFIVMQIVYGADRPVHSQAEVEEFAGFVFGRVVAALVIALLGAWIAYRLSGRSTWYGTITFSLVLALLCFILVWRSKLSQKASLFLPSDRADPPSQVAVWTMRRGIS